MRGFAISLLAGLLAVTAPNATALCLEDAEGGCGKLRHTLAIEFSEDCPDEDATLCLVDKDGNLSQAPNDAHYNITLTNGLGSDVTFELFQTGRGDDPTSDDADGSERQAIVRIATIDVPAGETVRLDEVYIDGNTTHVRLQALADDGRHGEADAELLNFRIMMMEPGEPEPAPEDEGALDDDGADAASKGSPGLPLALLVLGCLGAVLAARRLK